MCFSPVQCLLTHEELAHIKTHRAAAALVEDEPSGSAREATTFTAAFSMDRGPLDMLIVQSVKTVPRNVTERLSNDDHDPAAHGHIGRRDEPEQRRTSVDPSL